MDLRVKRTRQSIINAFIKLRSKKPLEKITVKELSELAFINKATFYSHYNDIYDLAEQLEIETIDEMLSSISHPEELITNPTDAIKTLALTFLNHKQLIDTLFSGSRASIFVDCLEDRIKNRIYTASPEYKNNLELDIILTYLIQGSFHVFLSNAPNVDNQELIRLMGNICNKMLSV